jgi:hypothetical protein
MATKGRSQKEIVQGTVILQPELTNTRLCPMGQRILHPNASERKSIGFGWVRNCSKAHLTSRRHTASGTFPGSRDF